MTLPNCYRFLSRRFDRLVSINLDEHWGKLSELGRRQHLQQLLGLEQPSPSDAQESRS